MSSALIGMWREALRGTSFDDLKPVPPRKAEIISFREDGTADWGFANVTASEGAVAPFPTTWEIAEDGTLSIWIPIPPMLEYDMPEWSREQLCHSVLRVEPRKLVLSDRPFDGEFVKVFERLE